MFFAAIAVPHRFDMWLPPVSHAQYHPSTHLSIYPFPLPGAFQSVAHQSLYIIILYVIVSRHKPTEAKTNAFISSLPSFIRASVQLHADKHKGALTDCVH